MPLPNFIVIGAAKAGTTALYWYLAEHPAVFMSPVKETNYFAYGVDASGRGPLVASPRGGRGLSRGRGSRVFRPSPGRGHAPPVPRSWADTLGRPYRHAGSATRRDAGSFSRIRYHVFIRSA